MKIPGLLLVGLMVCGAPLAAQTLASVPAWFEPNPGLYPASVKYSSHGAGYTLLAEQTGAVIALAGESSSARMRIVLLGGNAQPSVEALEPRAARTDYFLGNQPEKWKRNIPHFAQVRYKDAYPGIDLVYFGAGRQVEYNFVVSPGADPRRIRVRFQGADSVRLEKDGSLVVSVGGLEVVQPRPVAYQPAVGGGRVKVESHYILARNREVHFALGAYDRKEPLVIDPVLVYAGYYGGSTYDAPTGMAVDSQGNVWLTGTTYSTITLPEQNAPYKDALVGNLDIFVAELSAPANGPATLLYFTYFGGTANDYGGQIAVDNAGNVYLTGSTLSTDFPVTSNAFQSKLGGPQNTQSTTNQDAAVVKLNPAASGNDSLVFSSYLGGTQVDAPTALTLAPDGTMLVVGYTGAGDLDPLLTPTVQPGNRGGWDGFFYRINPDVASGATLVYNTYIGGGSTDVATGVAMDAAGAVYICGYTRSADFPIAGNFLQDRLRGGSDLFLVKLDFTHTGLDALVYATYLGGGGLDIAGPMAIDPGGGVWLSGYTLSRDFPVTANAVQRTFGGGISDVILTRLDLSEPSTQAITYSTFFGGSGTEVAYGLTPLGPGKVAVTGYTTSDDLPLKGALPAGQHRSSQADAYVAIVDASLAGPDSLTYSTYFGGSNNDVGIELAPDKSGGIYVAGYTVSGDLPVTDGSAKPSPGGSTSGFLLRVDDPQPGPPLGILPGPLRVQPASRPVGEPPVRPQHRFP